MFCCIRRQYFSKLLAAPTSGGAAAVGFELICEMPDGSLRDTLGAEWGSKQTEIEARPSQQQPIYCPTPYFRISPGCLSCFPFSCEMSRLSGVDCITIMANGCKLATRNNKSHRSGRNKTPSPPRRRASYQPSRRRRRHAPHALSHSIKRSWFVLDKGSPGVSGIPAPLVS